MRFRRLFEGGEEVRKREGEKGEGRENEPTTPSSFPER
jgi:hypothetical protein